MKKNLKEQIDRGLELMDVWSHPFSHILKEQSPDLNTLLSDTTITTRGDKMSIEYGGNRQCFKLWVTKVGTMDVKYATKKSNGVWDIDFCIPLGKGTVIKLAMGLINSSLPRGVTASHKSSGCEKSGFMNDQDMLDLRIDPNKMGWDAEEFEQFLIGNKVLDFNSNDAELKAYSC